MPRAVRRRDRQGRVPRACRAARSCTSSRPRRSRSTRRRSPSFRDYAAEIVRNARALADGLAARGLPHRVGRHRQPPHARRPAAVRRHRQGRPGGARPGRHHAATRTRSRTTPRSRSSPAGSGSAPPRSPPRAWASRRWRRSPTLIATVLRARRRRRHVAQEIARRRPTASARSSRRTRSSPPAGRARSVGGYAVIFAVAALTTLVVTPLVRRLAIRIGAIVRAGRRAACTRSRRRRSAARRCSSGSSSRWRWRRRSRSSTRCSTATSEPVGLMLARRRDVRRRRARRPPRRVAAGEGRRAWCWPGSLLSLLGVTMLYFRIPFATSTTTSCCRPTSRRSSPCSSGRGVRERDQPHRRPRRPRRGHRRPSPAPRCSSTPTGCSRAASSRARTSRRWSRSSRSGICVGFLPYNFNPARIIMGDAGALFLGLLLATTTITIGGRTDRPVQRATPTSSSRRSFIPIVILGVPILDTVFSFFRRVVPAHSRSRRRQGPPPPPAHAARATDRAARS